jgi:hypothetical protein
LHTRAHVRSIHEPFGSLDAPDGIDQNRVVIETLLRYLVEQRTAETVPGVDALFAESTHHMRLGI